MDARGSWKDQPRGIPGEVALGAMNDSTERTQSRIQRRRVENDDVHSAQGTGEGAGRDALRRQVPYPRMADRARVGALFGDLFWFGQGIYLVARQGHERPRRFLRPSRAKD